ncbi:MAG: replication-relaxation family protein [Planctomycetes bacterium]|nr:replication-relaxation family protein [Planctomycetota bacterium]
MRERPHFRAILAFVHRNRFAVASQIQRRFPQQLPSDRTARRHLAEMESLGYLDVVETNGTSPLWPKVYFVTRRGLARLRNALKEKGKEWTESAVDRRRSTGSSSEHVLHELFTTEFLLMVWQTAHKRSDLEILTIQRRSLAKHEAFKTVLAGRQTRLQPDAMFLYRQYGKGMMACFVELDLDSMTPRQMATKFRRYQAWADSATTGNFLKNLYEQNGAKKPAATFRILVVVGSRNRQSEHRRFGSLLQVVQQFPAAFTNRIWFTSMQQLHEVAEASTCFTARIWRRPRDIAVGGEVSDLSQIQGHVSFCG